MCNYWRFDKLSPIVIAVWLMEYWENHQKWIIAFYSFNEKFGNKYFMLFQGNSTFDCNEPILISCPVKQRFFSVIPQLYHIELWKFANMLILLNQSIISNLKCVALIDCEEWAIQTWKIAKNSRSCPLDSLLGGYSDTSCGVTEENFFSR